LPCSRWSSASAWWPITSRCASFPSHLTKPVRAPAVSSSNALICRPQAVSSTDPAFTAAFALLLTRKIESRRTYLTLIPIVIGTAMASGVSVCSALGAALAASQPRAVRAELQRTGVWHVPARRCVARAVLGVLSLSILKLSASTTETSFSGSARAEERYAGRAVERG
jgi:hypothetical protein